MKSLKLKIFEYCKDLDIEQTEVSQIFTEHIDLCDNYSEKEILVLCRHYWRDINSTKVLARS